MKIKTENAIIIDSNDFNELIKKQYKQYFDFRDHAESYECGKVYRITSEKLDSHNQQVLQNFVSGSDEIDYSLPIVLLKDLIKLKILSKGIYVIEDKGD